MMMIVVIVADDANEYNSDGNGIMMMISRM